MKQMTLEEIIKAYVECECPMGTSSERCPGHVALARVVELETERDEILTAAVDRVVAATVGMTSDGALQDAIINAILNH